MAVVGEKVLELQVFAENENKDFENDCDSDFEVIEQDDLFEVVPTTEIRLIMRQSNGVSLHIFIWLIQAKVGEPEIRIWQMSLGNAHEWYPTIFDDFRPPYLFTISEDL